MQAPCWVAHPALAVGSPCAIQAVWGVAPSSCACCTDCMARCVQCRSKRGAVHAERASRGLVRHCTTPGARLGESGCLADLTRVCCLHATRLYVHAGGAGQQDQFHQRVAQGPHPAESHPGCGALSCRTHHHAVAGCVVRAMRVGTRACVCLCVFV